MSHAVTAPGVSHAPPWGCWTLVIDSVIVGVFESREALEKDPETLSAFCRGDDFGLHTPLGDYYPFAEWPRIVEE